MKNIKFLKVISVITVFSFFITINASAAKIVVKAPLSDKSEKDNPWKVVLDLGIFKLDPMGIPYLQGEKGKNLYFPEAKKDALKIGENLYHFIGHGMIFQENVYPYLQYDSEGNLTEINFINKKYELVVKYLLDTKEWLGVGYNVNKKLNPKNLKLEELKPVYFDSKGTQSLLADKDFGAIKNSIEISEDIKKKIDTYFSLKSKLHGILIAGLIGGGLNPKNILVLVLLICSALLFVVLGSLTLTMECNK